MLKTLAIIMLAVTCRAVDVVLGIGGPTSFTGTGNNLVASWGSADVLYGLVAWWKMDESAWIGADGEVADSVDGNNATALGGAFVTNGYGHFNGSSAYVVTTNSFQIEKTFTACGWFRRDYIYGNEGKLFWHLQEGGAYYGWQVYMLPDDRIKANVGSYQTDWVITDNPISNAEWHFVALVSNGTTFKLYVDGVSASADQNVGGQTFTSEPLRIAKGIGANEWFSGDIDNARLYNRALSSNEVAAIYNRYK